MLSLLTRTVCLALLQEIALISRRVSCRRSASGLRKCRSSLTLIVCFITVYRLKSLELSFDLIGVARQSLPCEKLEIDASCVEVNDLVRDCSQSRAILQKNAPLSEQQQVSLCPLMQIPYAIRECRPTWMRVASSPKMPSRADTQPCVVSSSLWE